MSNSYLATPAVFLIETLFGLYILIVVLRFLLQLFHADFYNPVSQFIVKATTPVLRPLRRIIPGLAGLDVASIVLAWLLQAVALLLIGMVLGLGFKPLAALLWAIPALTELVINIFLYGILIQVILSWVAPASHNPAVSLLYTLTEPILAPARRLLPPISGLDLSPMLVLIGLMLLKMLLLPPLKLMTGSPF